MPNFVRTRLDPAPIRTEKKFAMSTPSPKCGRCVTAYGHTRGVRAVRVAWSRSAPAQHPRHTTSQARRGAHGPEPPHPPVGRPPWACAADSRSDRKCASWLTSSALGPRPAPPCMGTCSTGAKHASEPAQTVTHQLSLIGVSGKPRERIRTLCAGVRAATVSRKCAWLAARPDSWRTTVRTTVSGCLSRIRSPHSRRRWRCWSSRTSSSRGAPYP